MVPGAVVKDANRRPRTGTSRSTPEDEDEAITRCTGLYESAHPPRHHAIATKDTAATLQPREGFAAATRPRLIDLHLCSLPDDPRGPLRKRNDVLQIRVPRSGLAG